MADEIDNLGAALAEDHKAAKKRGGKSAAEKAGDKAAGQAEAAGSPEDEAAALGTVVEEAVAEVTGEGNAVAENAATADAGEVSDAGDDEARSVIADRIENIAADADLNTRTLVGDLRDTLIDLFKTRPKPWSQMREDDQRAVVSALTHAAKDLVSTAVQLISEAGNGAFMAKLEKYADGGGLKINLTAESTTDNVLACHAAQGQFVMVTRYDPKPFSGERRPAATEPDEPEMAFDGDKGDPAPAAPPSDDSDLAGDDPFGDDGDPAPAAGQAGQIAGEEPTFVVFDKSDEHFLAEDLNGWTADEAEAGHWPRGEAERLGNEHADEGAEIVIHPSGSHPLDDDA